MSVKLGIAPIAWSNDDMPELGGDTSLEQCLSEASQAGFIGIESGGKFPKNSEELIPKLKEFSLNLCSGWYGANLRKIPLMMRKFNTRSAKIIQRLQFSLYGFCRGFRFNSRRSKQKTFYKAKNES